MKTWICGIISFLLYATAIFFGDAYSAGSTLREGLGHALIFGTFGIVVTFPVMISLGFFLRWAFERLFRCRMVWRTVLPWFVHMPISVLLLLSIGPRSPESLYRGYVSSDVPRSLSEVRFWHTRGFGNSNEVISFKVDPSEFGKVLTRHQYVKNSDPHGYQPLERFTRTRPDFPISMPSEPLVEMYTYDDPKAGKGGGLYIYHYTTARHDFVITIQSFN